MLTNKWIAACVLLTSLVFASCGKQDTTSGKTTEGTETTETTETTVEASGPEESSDIEEPAGGSTETGTASTGSGSGSTGPTATSTNPKAGDTNGGDFALTGQKWEWIYWDGNKDGQEEQISFEYVDNGDEAESFILVTLEVGGSSEAYIDRARRIVRIFDKEDEEGPYLLVEYNYENRLTEKADMECTVRLRDGAVVVEL